MQKNLSFIIFFFLVIVIITLIHYYLWLRLVKNTNFNAGAKNIGTYFFIILSISFPLIVAFSRLSSFKTFLPLLWVCYLWLGIMFLLFSALLFFDVIKLFLFITSKFFITSKNPICLERREFISRAIGLTVSAFALKASYSGVKNYFAEPIVVTKNISLTNLPSLFKGFKIVQISDLHIGQLMTGNAVKEIVYQVNSLNPDIIAITGDLVDGSTAKLLKEVTYLKNLKAKRGVFFVTGNHEYYSGVSDWIPEIEKMGIEVLSNKSVKIEKGDDYFYLVGVNDHKAKKFGKKHAADFDKAFLNLEDDKKKILLAHRPIAVKEAFKYGVDLVLSGHTHGGQIWPFQYLVYLKHPYLKGLYQYKSTKLYVNQGTGCWGPPMRLGSFNEITEITLS